MFCELNSVDICLLLNHYAKHPDSMVLWRIQFHKIDINFIEML